MYIRLNYKTTQWKKICKQGETFYKRFITSNKNVNPKISFYTTFFDLIGIIIFEGLRVPSHRNK